MMRGKETLKGLRPYTPGRPIEEVQKEYGIEKIVKLASNENPFGYSNEVKKFLQETVTDLQLYPDGGAVALKEAIAEYYQVETEQLIVGAGLDEVIQIVSRAYLTPADEIIVPDPTFPQYAHHAIIEGAKVIKVPVDEKTGEMALEDMLKEVTENTKIIWLCNPNNPTGTYVSQEKITSFLEQVPKDVLVISDEAYQEFVTIEEESSTLAVLEQFPNLMVMKTFSKAYGIAGLRVGYGIASRDIIQTLEVTRLPFNTNSLGQQAAIVALKDQDFIKETSRINREELTAWESFLEEHQMPYYVSQTNFIFFSVGDKDQGVTQYLLEQGFIIRGGLKPGWLRITIGLPEDNETLRKYLLAYLAK